MGFYPQGAFLMCVIKCVIADFCDYLFVYALKHEA